MTADDGRAGGATGAPVSSQGMIALHVPLQPTIARAMRWASLFCAVHRLRAIRVAVVPGPDGSYRASLLCEARP